MSCSVIQGQKPHAVAIPSPAQGHLNPLMRFCKILASNGFTITFVNIDPIHQRILQCEQREKPQEKAAGSLDIRRVSIPMDGLDLANDFKVSFTDVLTATQALSDPIERLIIERISKEGPPVTCLISDVFMSGPTQRVADKLGIPRVALFPSSQSWNLLFFYIHSNRIPLEEAIRVSSHRDRPAEVFCEGLPGLPPLRNQDMPPFKHILEEANSLIPILVRQCQIAYESAHTIVVNSFEELEAPAFEAMAKQLPQPVYGVGPLIEHLEGESNTSLWREEDHCLQWLDQQPPRSVLYISFGSITLLSKRQFEEVLAGLQASGQRFLWAFRADLVEGDSSLQPDFLEATKNRGCIVTWAPQLRVLAHPCVGGFLTHCGWNSTTEAIAAGVPMLCWPYMSDQLFNAKYIVEEWQVGLRFKAGLDGGLVGRSEVERVVRALMEEQEGKTVWKNAAKVSEAARRSLQAGGLSYRNIQSFVEAFSRQAI